MDVRGVKHLGRTLDKRMGEVAAAPPVCELGTALASGALKMDAGYAIPPGEYGLAAGLTLAAGERAVVLWAGREAIAIGKLGE